MLTPRVAAILALYFGPAVAGPLSLRQEKCGGTWECQSWVGRVAECARPCIADAAKQVGCSATDFECRCKNKDDISNIATTCVLLESGCTPAEMGETITATNGLCPCVAKNGPPQPDCPSVSSTVSSSAKPSAEPSVAPSAVSSADPSVEPSVVSSAEPSVEPSVVSSAEPSGVPSSSAGVTTPAPSSTPGPSSSGSASVSSSTKVRTTCKNTPVAPGPTPTPAPGGGDGDFPEPVPGPWECTPFVDAIHDCAKTCIAGGAAEVGCDASDFVCRCANAAKISELVIDCVLDACGVTTGLEVREQTVSLCSCVASNPPIIARDYKVGQEEDEDDCIPAIPAVTPPKGDDDYPSKPHPPKTDEPTVTSPKTDKPVITPPKTDKPTTTTKPEPPVVTAGAAKQMVGSGAAALLALVAIL